MIQPKISYFFFSGRETSFNDVRKKLSTWIFLQKINLIILYMFTAICWQVKLRIGWCCHKHHDLFPRNWTLWTNSTSPSVFGVNMLTLFEWYPLVALTSNLCIEVETSFEVWRSSNKGKLSTRKFISGITFLCVDIHKGHF